MTAPELAALRQRNWASWIEADASSANLLRFVEIVAFLPVSAAADVWPSLDAWLARHAADPADASLLAAEEAAAHAWLADFVRAKQVAELAIWPSGPVYVSADLLPNIYVWRGDRHPERDFERQVEQGRISPLAGRIYAALLAGPAMGSTELRDRLGAQRTSIPAVLHGLRELAASLKIVPVEIAGPEPRWQPLCAAFPHVPRAISTLSRPAAALALVVKYLEVAVVAEEAGIAEFFAPILPGTAVRSALSALASARQTEATAVDGRPAVQLFRQSQPEPY